MSRADARTHRMSFQPEILRLGLKRNSDRLSVLSEYIVVKLEGLYVIIIKMKNTYIRDIT